LLVPANATDWSNTHSPMPRYLFTHLFISPFSPVMRSLLTLEWWIVDYGQLPVLYKENHSPSYFLLVSVLDNYHRNGDRGKLT
jgi:hypothetical protein